MILILGGSGFVGQHVAATLVAEGQRVIVTASSRGDTPPLLACHIESGEVVVERVDVTDPFSMMAVFARHAPSTVIDLTGRHPKALPPGADVRFRTDGLLNMLEAARINGTRRVVLMSSMDVYWGLDEAHIPFREDMPVPLIEQDDHYIVQSWVKKSLEIIGNLYRRQAGMDVVFVRASGIYGPLYRTMLNIPSRIAHAAAGRYDLSAAPLPAAEDGYDQLYVKDMAAGVARVLLAEKLDHIAYNLGSGGAPTHGRFAAAAEAAAPGFTVKLPSRRDAAEAQRPANPMNGRWQDISRARDELGFAPRFTLEEAMAEYIAWLRDHPF